MSIVQAIMGTVQGAAQPPYYYIGVGGTYGEGNTVGITIYYENARQQTVYWSIVDDSATAGVDYTSNAGYSGSIYTNGTNQTTVAYVTNIADNTTEGTEWYYVRAGTYPGGNDLAQAYVNINDTSIAPLADFTIEWWQNMDNSQPGSYPRLFNVGSYPNEKPGISFEGASTIYVWGGDGGGNRDAVYGADFGKGQWVHWAIVRHNSTSALYRNGVNQFNSNSLGTTVFNNNSSSLTLGWGSNQYWNGRIAGFHWIKGLAKYTGNFNPIKAPVTPTASSKYLLNVVDDSGKFADATGNHTLQSSSGTISFSADSPWYYAPVTASLSGASGTTGFFIITAGWASIKPGWTITRSGGGYTSTVTEVPGGNQIVVADAWPTDGGSSTYTISPPTSIVYSSGNVGGYGGGRYEIQLDPSYTNLENVKAGWTVTSGSWSDTVTRDAYSYYGSYRVEVSGGVEPPGGSYTFTPPTQTGSLVFNTSYISIAGSSDWAFDI